MTSQLTKVFDFRDFHLRVKKIAPVKQNPKSHGGARQAQGEGGNDGVGEIEKSPVKPGLYTRDDSNIPDVYKLDKDMFPTGPY